MGQLAALIAMKQAIRYFGIRRRLQQPAKIDDRGLEGVQSAGGPGETGRSRTSLNGERFHPYRS